MDDIINSSCNPSEIIPTVNHQDHKLHDHSDTRFATKTAVQKYFNKPKVRKKKDRTRRGQKVMEKQCVDRTLLLERGGGGGFRPK